MNKGVTRSHFSSEEALLLCSRENNHVFQDTRPRTKFFILLQLSAFSLPLVHDESNFPKSPAKMPSEEQEPSQKFRSEVRIDAGNIVINACDMAAHQSALLGLRNCSGEGRKYKSTGFCLYAKGKVYFFHCSFVSFFSSSPSSNSREIQNHWQYSTGWVKFTLLVKILTSFLDTFTGVSRSKRFCGLGCGHCDWNHCLGECSMQRFVTIYDPPRSFSALGDVLCQFEYFVSLMLTA